MNEQLPTQSSRTPLVLWGAIAVIVVAFIWMFDVEITPSKEFAKVAGKEVKSPSPDEANPQVDASAAQDLAAAVIPQEGYEVPLRWGDTGVKLVKAGGIDMEKYKQNYSDPKLEELLAYLTGSQDKGITITADNAYFWVNTLWALGLTQKSDVLDKGVMGTQYKGELGNFASTGGWTLGAKDAVSLYSSADIIPLTSEQQALVAEISSGVYRPCCGNPTSFPDCNHGMAALGLIELMVSQGFSENEIYRALLAFNSFWFSQTYLDLAYYFETQEGTSWDAVDPKRVLSNEFSSASGYAAIKEKVGTVPGSASSGGGCGA